MNVIIIYHYRNVARQIGT